MLGVCLVDEFSHCYVVYTVIYFVSLHPIRFVRVDYICPEICHFVHALTGAKLVGFDSGNVNWGNVEGNAGFDSGNVNWGNVEGNAF